MYNIWKRSLAMLLAILMVVGQVPVSAFATEEIVEEVVEEVIEEVYEEEVYEEEIVEEVVEEVIEEEVLEEEITEEITEEVAEAVIEEVIDFSATDKVANAEATPKEEEIAPVVEDGVKVAYIGEAGFETVQAAINAANDGDIVTIGAGEFAPINISNKNNITIEGTKDENGELLTIIKGGNPAITGHGFNGIIKDLKIVDAWKVMYAEPAGNVTVDNVYVTGATYGFHLVAYSAGLTWKIQNSYMDLSWANSFGKDGAGDAEIVITGNKFVSTSPYYPDAGANHVNSFLPNVTITENIFGKNAKILIRPEVTDTSNVIIAENYHADIDNAFADGGADVKIESYYAAAEDVGDTQKLIVMPKGTVTYGFVGQDSIWGEATSNTKGSLVVKLYEGETEIATATLSEQHFGKQPDGSTYVTWSIPFVPYENDSWSWTWAEGYPSCDMAPTAVKLYSDGVHVATNEVQFNGPDNINKIVAMAADKDGKVLGAYTSLADLPETASTVVLKGDSTGDVIMPAGATLIGNGYAINGTLTAGGDLTFVGHTKATAFSAGYYNRTITIGEGACLEITGTGRVTLGYGNTFNVTGSIADAKTADKANVQPSLIIPGGISITGGNDAAMNVTNAYVSIGNTSNKNSVANGTFDLKFTNSIVDFTNQFTLAEPTGGMNPTFQVSFEDSVVTTATKLCVAAPNSTVDVKNSTVTLGSYLRNSGNLNLTEGSVLTGSMIQFGENGGNDGTITVDASTLTIESSSAGHAMDGNGTGKLIVANGGSAEFDHVIETNVTVDTESSLTVISSIKTGEITVDAKNYDGKSDVKINLGNATDMTLNTVNSEDVMAKFDANGKFVLAGPTATIGDKNYFDLQTAVNATAEDDVIVMANDEILTESVVIGADKWFTLDLNGQSITAEGITAFQLAGGMLTIKGNGKVTAATIVENNGWLTVVNGTYEGTTLFTGTGDTSLAGGDFTGDVGTVQASGGTYDREVAAENLADDYGCIERYGKFVVEKVEAVATIMRGISTTHYATLAEAIVAARPYGDTITMNGHHYVGNLSIPKNVTIDLNGYTLHMTAGDNKTTGNVTIKNGTVDISDVYHSGNGIFQIGSGKLNLTDVNVIGDGYTSSWAVFAVENGAALNVTGGEWTLSNDQSSSGGVFKSQAGNGTAAAINVNGTVMNFDNVARGFNGGTYTLESVELTITGGDNGINGGKLIANNSTITITDGAGRGLTISEDDAVITNSTVTLSGNGEGDILFRSEKAVTYDDASVVNAAEVLSNVKNAKINGEVVTATSAEPGSIVDSEYTNPDWNVQLGEDDFFMTLQEAINAATAENNTIELLDDIQETASINKSGVAVIINGNDVSYAGSVQINIGQNVTINNINFVHTDDSARDFIANVGSPTGKNYNTTLVVDSCTFEGNGCDNVVAVRTTHPTAVTISNSTGTGLHSMLQNTGGQKVTIKNVSVEDSKGGLAMGGVRAVEVDGLNMDVVNYGIRLDGGSDTVANISNVTAEAFVPVLLRKATSGYTVNFSGTNNLTAENEKGAAFVAVGGDVDTNADIADSNGVKVIPSVNGLKETEVFIAKPLIYIERQGYATLQDAVDAASAMTGNVTIHLNGAVAGDATIVQKEGVNITIDGAREDADNSTFDGTITIHGQARYDGDETLTIQNVAFTTSEKDHDFISSNETGSVERYAHNVTVKDCSFTATGEAVHTAVAMRIRQGYDIKVENVTVKDLHSLIQGDGITGFTATNVTVDAKNGINMRGASVDTVIEESNIKSADGGYGIRMEGASKGVTITDSTVNASVPVLIRKLDADNWDQVYNVVVDNNTMTANDSVTDKSWLVAVGNDYDGDLTKVTASKYTVKVNDVIVTDDDEGIYVAMCPVYIGTVGYASLEEALKAVEAEQTIRLEQDITIDTKWDCRNNGAKITADNVTIDGNGHTLIFTGEIKDNNWNTVFRFEGDNAKVQNLTIDVRNATGAQRIISSKLSITVDNCNFIGNGTKYGVIVGEGAGDQIGNVTATVKDSTFENLGRGVRDNDNGQNVKSFTVTGNTFVNAKVALSASEKVTFTGNITNSDVTITSYASKNELAVVATGNTLNPEAINTVTANPDADTTNVQEGFKLPVATDGSKFYLTLAAAKGKSIQLLTDVAESGDLTGTTIDLNGKTLTGDVLAKLVMNGGTYKTTQYTMVAPSGALYESTDAVITISGATLDTTLHSGTMTVVGKNNEWYTMEGQTLTIEGGKFVIPENVTLCHRGYAYVNGGQLTVDGTIKLIHVDAKVTAPAGLNVVSGVDGVGVKYADGVYSLGGFIVLNQTTGETYTTLGEAVANASDGNEIILNGDTVENDITVDKNVTIDAGKHTVKANITITADEHVTLSDLSVDGTLKAGTNMTLDFYGENKATVFNPYGGGNTINIKKGGSLEVTGGSRMTVGYGNIFNIEGVITDAKTADKATIKPALNVSAGISMTGNGATLNVNNAYIKLGLSTGNKSASGNFEINFTNSVADFANNFGFHPNATNSAEINATNSVLNFATNLDLINATDMTINNSVVTVGSSMRNDGALNLVNGSEMTVKYQIQAGEHGGHKGVINVSGSKLNVNTDSIGHAVNGLDTGKLVLVNGAVADIGFIKNFKEITIGKDSELITKPITVNADCVLNVNSGILTNAEVINNGTVNVTGGELSVTTLVNNGSINVTGESTLNIPTLTGEEINLLDGAIVKDSKVCGKVFVAGKVIFRGDNTVNMLYDYGTLTDYYGTTANMEWTVEEGASLTIANKERYGLGYGDNITIVGQLQDGEALTGRENLDNIKKSFFSHGIVAQESKGWDCQSSMTVKNAFVEIGSNNSFGNKPGNYGGEYTISFENAIVNSSRITFYEALSKTTFTMEDTDAVVGTFMTRDTDSTFTLTNSKLLSTTDFNGTDEGNFHAGTLVLTNSGLTYSAPVVIENGTISIDATSKLTAPSIEGNGKLIIDATGMNAGPLVTVDAVTTNYTGEIEVINNPAVRAEIINGQIFLLANEAKIGDVGYATLEEAIAAAQNGETVQLLDNLTRSAVILIDKNVKIDGNNKSITSSATRVIRVTKADVEVEINNLKMVSTCAVAYPADVRGISIDDVTNTTVTLNNCSVDFTDATAHDWSYAVNVVGGSGHKVTVNGGTYEGANVINVRGANNTVTVKDATLNCLYLQADVDYGAAIWVQQNQGSSVEATGNTFNGDNAVAFNLGTGTDLEESNNTDNTRMVMAKCGNTYYYTLADAVAAANDGETVTLLHDETISELIKIEKAITIELNGKKVTSTAQKAFEVYANATIKNGTIEAVQRAVDTRKAVALTLADVDLIADKYTSAYGNPQPLTIGGSENGTKVTMTNVKIDAGTAGYGIITFVETELTATDSTISGYSALYVKPGSENSVFNFNGSTTLSGSTASNDVEGNSFSTIAVRADGVTVNMDATSTVNASGKYCHAVSLGGVYAGEEKVSGANVAIAGAINGQILASAAPDVNTVTVKAEYAQTLMDDGYAYEAAGEGMIKAAITVAKIGNQNYTSINNALNAAVADDEVIILAGNYNQSLTVSKDITVIGETDAEGNNLVNITGKLSIEANGATVKNINVTNSGTACYVGAKDVLIEGCTLTGSNGLYQSYTSGTVTFKDSTITGGTYGIHFDGNAGGNIVIDNCTITGWTSFAGTIEKVTMTDTTFADGNYNQLRLYQDAELNNVKFNEEMTVDFGKNEVSADFNNCDVVDATGNVTDKPLTDVIYLGDIAEMGVKATEDGNPIIVEAGIDGNYYLTMAEAMEKAEAGNTIKLYADITGTGYVIDKNLTIDFNEHTYTVNKCVGSSGTETLGFQILKDNNVELKNGTLEATETVDGSKPVKVVIQNYANLTLTNMNLDGTGSDKMQYVLSNNSGTTYLNGETFIKAPEGAVAFDVYDYTAGGYALPVVNVNTYGTITGKIEVSEDATLAISGGTFTVPLAENWCAEGFIPVDNGNGTYGVKKGVFVAHIGNVGYEDLNDAFAAAVNGDEIEINVAGNYALTTSGKNITITGMVDGVVFDNIGAKNMGGANVTFNNVTFDYYPNVNYTGLQHAGNLVYNNCTIDGQVFLYGASETFNNCTFNQDSKDAYNVWTYGAEEVAFNECTFNSAGKSVLIYAESASITNDVTVNNSKFVASESVDGKAAIEMDSSLTGGIELNITGSTATGFGTGNVSGNNLWNNKKGTEGVNNDITVAIEDKIVLEPVYAAKIGDLYYTSLQAAVNAVKDSNEIEVLMDVEDATIIDKPVIITATDCDVSGNLTVQANATIIANELSDIISGNVTIAEGATLNINGGNFTGTVIGDINVSGGTFNRALTKEDCANGYYPTQKTAQTYGVTDIAVAQNGDMYFGTLKAAVDLAEADDTIKLLMDTKAMDVVVNEKINLDMNGKTLNVNDDIVINNGLTIVNAGEINATGDIFFVKGGVLSISGGKYSTTGAVIVTDGGKATVAEGIFAVDAPFKGENIYVSGGIFREKVTEEYLANGYRNRQENSGEFDQWFRIEKLQSIMMVGQDYHYYMDRAVAAIENNEGNVTLTANIRDIVVTLPANRYIDGDRYNYSIGGDSIITLGAGASIENVNLDETVQIKAVSGYYVHKTSNGYIAKAAAASIDDVGYATLQAAVNAAEENAIITLHASGETATVAKELTIDQNGFTATITAGEGYEVKDEDGKYIVKVKVEETKTIITHTGTNLRLQDLIKIGFYFDAVSEEPVESVGALLWTAEQYAAETDFTVNSALAKHYENVEKNGSAYIIETDGIRAQNLDDTFVMIPYAKTASGYTYGPAKEYNALVYCEWAYKNGNSNLQSLIVDLLNYATLAREYFCITENLPAMANGFNSLLSEADRVVEWDDSLKVSYPTVNEPGTFDAKYAGRNVNLKDALSAGLYFTNMTVAGGYVWNEADYKANTEHTAENRTTVTVDERASNNVKLNVVGLFAYNIYDNYYVRAYNANGDLGATVATSIAGYLSYQVDNANTATAQGQALKALAQAMLVYGDNARSNPSINKNN